ncbi:hypothetical protein NOU13_24510 [Rhodococcus erythropolis]|uniref:hypothetical protein n=1 Tax=Rhodococcus erythropolis TaxID=1833 RepID=UPI00210DA398|nr:hypothetical protein [Rhodococcus erythropolis]MCQ4127667.1 hypothetical protein [Rhodococcus erythropolis]
MATNTPPPSDVPADPSTQPARGTTVRGPWALVLVLLIAVAAMTFLFFHERTNGAERAGNSATEDAAVAAARNYVSRFINYRYNDLDPFFANFAEGLADEDAARWKELEPLLRPTLEERQVESEGTVTHAADAGEADGLHSVLVYGSYTFKNIDNPNSIPADVAMLVNVRETGGRWQIESVRTPSSSAESLGGTTPPLGTGGN